MNGSVVSGAYYVYDEKGRLIGEYDAAGLPIQEYVYLDSEPVATLKAGSAYYIETDHLGTPRAVVEPGSGFLLWKWDLQAEPFGASAASTYVTASGFSMTLNLRFPGQFYDAETGLHYNYHRDFNPGAGRYVESDPIGLEASTNTYAYSENTPFLYFDPFGLQIIPIPGPRYVPPPPIPGPSVPAPRLPGLHDPLYPDNDSGDEPKPKPMEIPNNASTLPKTVPRRREEEIWCRGYCGKKNH